MATLLVSSILSRAAGRLNDKAQSTYTVDVMLPHCADAWDELKADLDLFGSLDIKEQSASIVISQGITSFKNAGKLPDDLLEPIILKERLSGSTDLFTEMFRHEWTPDINQTDSLRYWNFRRGDILLVGATSDREIYIRYNIGLLDIVTANDDISLVRNCKPYLINRTAALAARFNGNNPTRADALDGIADRNKTTLIRLIAKNKQGVRTRRKPFRVGRSRGVLW